MLTLGPVGSGDHDGKQKSFQSPPVGDLGAIRIKASEFLEKIKTFTRTEVASLKPTKLRARKHTHWLILAPNEYVTYVEIRAKAWVDGLRIHTNLRATRWYGGFGGEQHVLRPHGDSVKINGFFGSRGENYVGKLGVHLSNITEPTTTTEAINFGPPVAVFTMTSVAGGEASEPHLHFDSEGTELGAIVIRCDDYVESIRVVTPDVHARATINNNVQVYDEDEQVFALRNDEYLTNRVTVRSGAWVDAVQFHTNLRSSEWFGGKEGVTTDEFECEEGFRICGLYGRNGDLVVDMLGVHMCENEPVIKKLGPVGLGENQGQQDPFCTEPSNQDLGAILVDADEFLNQVAAYTHDEYAELDDDDKEGFEWFVLQPGEFVSSVEVRAMSWVDGVRFHTNQRSSQWFGGKGGKLHRLEAKPGHKVFGFFGTIGDSFTGQLGALTRPLELP